MQWKLYVKKTCPQVDWITGIRFKKWVHETCAYNSDLCDNCFTCSEIAATITDNLFL